MKTITLYRAYVTPSAKGRRSDDRGFKAAFVGCPSKDLLLWLAAERANDLNQQLRDVRDPDNEDVIDAEYSEEEIKQKIENLATVLEILHAWKPDPQGIPADHPMAVLFAGVHIGVIKFESETVFDVRL